MSGRADGSDRRVLIVRLSALGDVVHVLPCLAALRAAWPAAHIGWVVEDKAASLLEGHPQLDRVHVLPRKQLVARGKQGHLLESLQGFRRLVAELRRERYGVTLDFQANFRSGLIARLSRAPRRIAQARTFAKEGSSLLFATDAPEPAPPEAHKIARNMTLLGPLGLPTGPAPRPVLPTSPAGEALAAAFAAEPGPRVVVQAGVSAFGAIKAWREDRFAGLAEGLRARGARVCFAYGPSEEAQARRLAEAAGAELAPPTRSLAELVALLGAADLFVGVDSGPLHLAAAAGTPVLGLYGPKHPGTYGPFWPGHRVVRSGIECSPCRHRRCPRPDVVREETPDGGRKISPCMDRLGAEAAVEAAEALLAGRLPARP